jgi:hypothetical protein
MLKPPTAFSSLEGLLELDRHDGIDMRPTLLRVLTDLYLQKRTHPPEDERYYTELALRLIDATDLPARKALASRLAPYPAAPRAVIARLARDVIEVAEPILTQSPCLTPADLKAIAEERGPTYAAIIATRGQPALPIEHEGLVPMQANASPESEAVELCELFFAAGGPERRLILLNLDYSSIAPSQPPSPMQRTDVWRLESAALQHNSEAVVRELERALGVSRNQARRIVQDELGEPVVVAAKAMSLPADVLQRMLLFVNPRVGQSVDRVYELATLYGEISVDAARRLIAIWRDAELAVNREVRHEASPWRTAADNARRALSDVSHRPPAPEQARLRILATDDGRQRTDRTPSARTMP